MSTAFSMSFDRVRQLLVYVCARNEPLVDAILHDTSPVFLVDRESDTETAFARLGKQNAVCIGEKRILRLEAHAYASSVILSVRAKTGFPKFKASDLRPQLMPADALLTWAVKGDLGAFLSQTPHLLSADDLLPGNASSTIDIVSTLNAEQRIMGRGFFLYALGFVILHELSHLRNGHHRCYGIESIAHERTADSDAARWMTGIDDPKASKNEADRQCALFGIAIGLMWLTSGEVFVGPHEATTHPNSYDRLYQILEAFTDTELNDDDEAVWHFVTMALACHMHAASYNFKPDKTAATWKQAASNLIDRISRCQRACE